MARVTIKELQEQIEKLTLENEELKVVHGVPIEEEVKKTRFNFIISVELKKWVDKQADMMGVSQAGFVNVCITNYRQQAEALKSMQDVNIIMTQLVSLKNDVEKIQEKGEI